jgi:hypothetical protein
LKNQLWLVDLGGKVMVGLEKVTHLSVIATCLIAIGLMITSHLGGGREVDSRGQSVVGTTLDLKLPASAPVNVVLALRARCRL